MKRIANIYSPPRPHWVGDGFPVRSLFTYDRMGPQHVSPFLMLDYAGPMDFEPAARQRGVGEHPHRGFETVTIVYDGELVHRDSSGGGGMIGKGDVQWMTAGAGVVHEELHSEAFTRNGGRFEVVQLWVNLPAADKSTPAGYQTLPADRIASVVLPNEAGEVNVIAGEFDGHSGPASTFSPINVWDLRMQRDGDTVITVPESHTTLLAVLSGTVSINGTETVQDAELVSFQQGGSRVRLTAQSDAKLLVMTGEPLNEPVVGHGPFVMNTRDEIRQAFADYHSGAFARPA